MKLSISLPDSLVARLDAAKGDLVPRSTWIAWAVEQALEGGPAGAASGVHVSTPAPAEPHARSSAQAKRAVQPIPKDGKK